MEKGFLKQLRTSEGWLLILILCVWIKPLLQQLYSVFKLVPVLNIFANNIQDWILVFATLLAFKAIKKRLDVFDIIIFTIFLCVYLFQYVLYPENTELLTSNAYTVLCTVIPLYFIGRSFNFSKCEKLLAYGSVLMLFYTIYMQIIFVSRLDILEDHRMVAAYNFLPHLLLFTYRFLKKRTAFNVLYTLLGIFLLLSLGNRGSVMCYLFFFVCSVIVMREISHRKRLILFSSIILVVLYINLIPFSVYMSNLVSNMGLSTRLFDLFLGDNFLYTDDRDNLINTLLNQLDCGTESSYGLFGSYRYIGVYPHRIYVELWFSFGYIIGTIIFCLLLFVFIRGFISARNDSEKIGFLILMCIGFIPLFFSGSFITQGMLFFFIGYCITLTKRNSPYRL